MFLKILKNLKKKCFSPFLKKFLVQFPPSQHITLNQKRKKKKNPLLLAKKKLIETFML